MRLIEIVFILSILGEVVIGLLRLLRDFSRRKKPLNVVSSRPSAMSVFSLPPDSRTHGVGRNRHISEHRLAVPPNNLLHLLISAEVVDCHPNCVN